MATTITAATLTITVTEEITLNGSVNGATNTREVTVNEIFKRIVTCPASQETTVLKFASAVNVASGDLAVGDCKYLRITNKDSANSCKVGYTTAATNFQVTLGPGESNVFGAPLALCIGDDASGAPAFGTLANLVSVIVDPAANAIDVEVFAASA
jgi:hypothetical protein